MAADTELKLELLKLDMLASLARSQRALARIVESVADAAAESPEASMRITEHAEAIARYQQQLSLRIAGALPRAAVRKRSALPAQPWLRKGVTGAAFRQQPP